MPVSLLVEDRHQDRYGQKVPGTKTQTYIRSPRFQVCTPVPPRRASSSATLLLLQPPICHFLHLRLQKMSPTSRNCTRKVKRIWRVPKKIYRKVCAPPHDMVFVWYSRRLVTWSSVGRSPMYLFGIISDAVSSTRPKTVDWEIGLYILLCAWIVNFGFVHSPSWCYFYVEDRMPSASPHQKVWRELPNPSRMLRQWHIPDKISTSSMLP